MRVVILGSGVVGVTSAWYLAKEGHDVTVIDRQDGPPRKPVPVTQVKSHRGMPHLGRPQAFL